MDERILIIDSHPVYIYKLEGFLRGLTYQNISLATTGKEGIEKTIQENPDLVFLSGKLSDTDSYELCQKITSSCQAKIIVLVGLLYETNTVARFNELGADAVLIRKEKDFAPLQQAVEQLLNTPDPTLSS